MTAIDTTDLTKRYGETIAVDALDLSIPAGVVYGFLGSNGAGKTTTMRLLTALTVLPGGLLAVLVVAPSVARTVVSGLVGFVPAFLLGLLPGGISATAAGWFSRLGTELQAAHLGQFRVGTGVILLIGGLAVAALLYRNAVHRFQRYSPQ